VPIIDPVPSSPGKKAKTPALTNVYHLEEGALTGFLMT
jgi:hypothetical protein